MEEALAVQASPNKKLKFTPTSIDRALLIQSQPLADERGYFARVWCQQEFAELGLNTDLVQCNLSHNHQRGTLRGMHYQRAPFEEAKVVRCTQGSIYDVIIDLRSDSPSFMHWQAFELSADNQQMLYIPEGCAHGFQTLTDSAQVFYQMSQPYHPEYASGVRWNDPAWDIEWPLPVSRISHQDQTHPDFNS